MHKSVALIVLYAEQDVNFTQQSCLSLENWKITLKFVKIRKKWMESGWNVLIFSLTQTGSFLSLYIK